jgi:hypothetical protein
MIVSEKGVGIVVVGSSVRLSGGVVVGLLEGAKHGFLEGPVDGCAYRGASTGC